MPRRPKGPWFWKFSGWWVVQIRGDRVKLARGRTNKKAAIRRYHEIMAALPDSLDSATVDVASLFEGFLDWSKESQAPDTYRGYLYYLQCFVDRFGRRQVRSLQPSDVDAWLKKKPTWGDTTRKNAIRFVKRALNWAVDERFISENPLAKVKGPTPATRVRCVTDDEYTRLVAAAPPEFHDYLVALRFTGSRTSELRKLLWNQRDGARFVLHDHKTVKKTKKPRVIYLSDEMVDLFNRMEARVIPLTRSKRTKNCTYSGYLEY